MREEDDKIRNQNLRWNYEIKLGYNITYSISNYIIYVFSSPELKKITPGKQKGLSLVIDQNSNLAR